MPHRIETAWYREESVEVEVRHRGAHVSLVAWTEYPGWFHEVYVENEELIFNEEEDLDEM